MGLADAQTGKFEVDLSKMVLCQIVLVDNKFDKCNFVKDDENHPFIMPLIRKIRAIKCRWTYKFNNWLSKRYRSFWILW